VNPRVPWSRRKRGEPAARCRLIVNADDFGLDEAINDGIALAHRHGIVTAVSLATVGRACAHAIDWCRILPGLDVGVHLTLVGERPLLGSATSLVDDRGRLPASAGLFLRRFVSGTLRLTDIRDELAAQIERALDAGLSVSHLDSHQHLHALPGIAALVQELARRYRVRFVRAPAEPLAGYMPREGAARARLAQLLVLRLVWRLSSVSRAMRQRPPAPVFLGFFYGGRLDRDRLRHLLSRLRPGRVYELMCHPGHAPRDARYQRWHYRHATELAALTDAAVSDMLRVRGIQLTSFATL
jgi:predicted glycoside hydrolase/deacetylase ChbG (UPF0249 family)